MCERRFTNVFKSYLGFTKCVFFCVDELDNFELIKLSRIYIFAQMPAQEKKNVNKIFKKMKKSPWELRA